VVDIRSERDNMRVSEILLSIPRAPAGASLLSHLRGALAGDSRLDGTSATRLVVTRTDAGGHECELGLIEGLGPPDEVADIFDFVRRGSQRCDRFTAVLLVPTGAGAEIGGHAGDAGPVARLLASACDTLVTHPNVVNGSDINELPENALYVEGSLLTRFLMGTVGLQAVRSNRVLVLLDAHRSPRLAAASINAVNAARATYGLSCPKIVAIDPPIRMRAEFNASGRASGVVSGVERILAVLRAEQGSYDAVALSSVIDVPHSFHRDYFDFAGAMVNPWGGVEALLTHAISGILDLPTAHAPMFESEAIANIDPGIVDPRMAAETVSCTFLQCVLKGLQRAPRPVRRSSGRLAGDGLTAEDVSCLVIPDGCLGLPTLAALEQGIAVIAVRENANLMQNDLAELPWSPGQFHRVENYWEAVGLMTALKAGIAPGSVRRPISGVAVETRVFSEEPLGLVAAR
jgi:hypothetical protein